MHRSVPSFQHRLTALVGAPPAAAPLRRTASCYVVSSHFRTPTFHRHTFRLPSTAVSSAAHLSTSISVVACPTSRRVLCRLLSTSLPSASSPPPHSASPPHAASAASPLPPHLSSIPTSSTHQSPDISAATATARIPHSPAGSATSGAGTVDAMQQSDIQSADAPPANESRLRRLVRQYGPVAVGSYLVIYVSTLGMLYVAIKERWLGGYDIQSIVDWLGVSEYMEHIDPRKGDFAVAWIATKFTEPLRLALTVAVTPTVARMVGRAPPKEGAGVRAKMEARVKEGVEQAKDKVEERIKERSTKQ